METRGGAPVGRCGDRRQAESDVPVGGVGAAIPSEDWPVDPQLAKIDQPLPGTAHFLLDHHQRKDVLILEKHDPDAGADKPDRIRTETARLAGRLDFRQGFVR